MEQFKIEVAVGDQGQFYDIWPLGHAKYEIFAVEKTVGTIQLDENNHAHCESRACELDLPALNVIHEGVQYHEHWQPSSNVKETQWF